MGYLRLPTSHRDTWATLMAFLLPLIFSILAWAKETLSLMVCSWLRLSSTRWEILPGKRLQRLGAAPQATAASCIPPASNSKPAKNQGLEQGFLKKQCYLLVRVNLETAKVNSQGLSKLKGLGMHCIKFPEALGRGGYYPGPKMVPEGTWFLPPTVYSLKLGQTE